MKVCAYCDSPAYGGGDHVECKLQWWREQAREQSLEAARYQKRCAELEARLDAIRKVAR